MSSEVLYLWTKCSFLPILSQLLTSDDHSRVFTMHTATVLLFEQGLVAFECHLHKVANVQIELEWICIRRGSEKILQDYAQS